MKEEFYFYSQMALGVEVYFTRMCGFYLDAAWLWRIKWDFTWRLSDSV